MSETDPAPAARVAVVGMACRVPGAASVEQYWKVLTDGVEAIRPLSREALLAAGLPPHLIDAPDYVPAAAILETVDLFDAAFFGLSPRQATVLDPQHRHLLECAWEALEDAGCDEDDDGRRTGVFAGAGVNSYLLTTLPRLGEGSPTAVFERMLANDEDFLATRVSYLLGLRGPSIGVQTACSTSLVAVHLACQSLMQYDCDTALAGGVTIRVPHVAGYRFVPGGIASPDGHCRAFDAGAAGTVFGSGVGLVVLKRLEDAIDEGYRIRAVIRGSAVTNDGADKVGYTAPSVNGQATTIRQAHANAGVTPDTIGYVETHGTGTALGDPVEIAALTRAFHGCPPQSCWIGSVKTNIGHLDAAAGVAGLIKAILAVERGVVPPSLHFTTPNPEIDFPRTPFAVNTRCRDWPQAMAPRRAGVSSFGMGGTNAHVVLEQAPPGAPSEEARAPQVLVWSARTEPAFAAMAERLRLHLAASEVNLADAAWTLQTGRRRLDHRGYLVCHDREEAVRRLAAAERPRAARDDRAARPVVLLFPGQGAQYDRMTQGLYEQLPAFAAEIDRCAQVLQPLLGSDIRRVLYPAPGATGWAAGELARTAIAQPALFAVEYALARVWLAWGVRPAALIGHSLGEWVAAAIGGACSLEDALALVVERGRLMEAQPVGAMSAVFMSEEAVRALVPETISVAAINGPDQCVVSGPPDALARFESTLDAARVRRLPSRRAFHSPMMDPVVEPFVRRVAESRLQPPAVPVISNVTGDWAGDDAARPAYWGRQLREPVRFSAGLDTLFRHEPGAVFLEVGPGRTLTHAARATWKLEQPICAAASLARADAASELAGMLATLGQLWVWGVEVDWRGVHDHARRQRVALPTYPFERRRYWARRADTPRPTIPAEERSDAPPAAIIARQRALIESQLALLESMDPAPHLPPATA